MRPEPVLTLGDASAYLIPNVGRGGRVHYAAASACLSAATGREIVVGQRPSGRARLMGGGPELGVSLSYRDGFLLVGHSPAATVGVDVEPDDASLDPVQLSRDHFSAGEAQAVAIEAADKQRDLFLRLWVLKEAVLKATGRGVYDGLDEPELSPALVALSNDDDAAIVVAASSRVPAAHAVVANIRRENAPPLYVALARLD